MMKLEYKALARSRTVVAAAAAALLIGGTVTGASAKPVSHHAHKIVTAAHVRGTGRSFSGVASFYGNDTDHATASGQAFDENKLTAAHRSLPFGTKLRVSHGGRSVIVTVNDRGPFVAGRVLDLSTAAARAVGLIGAGVGKITAEVIS